MAAERTAHVRSARRIPRRARPTSRRGDRTPHCRHARSCPRPLSAGPRPEELIAAAHAACFSMALSGGLAKAELPPKQLETSATVTFVPGTGITKTRSPCGATSLAWTKKPSGLKRRPRRTTARSRRRWRGSRDHAGRFSLVSADHWVLGSGFSLTPALRVEVGRQDEAVTAIWYSRGRFATLVRCRASHASTLQERFSMS